MAVRLGDKASSNGKKPGTPTIGTATAGNAQATVSFTPPSFLGKPAGSSYTIRAYTSSGTVDAGKSATGSTSPLTVTGLTNGTSYTFKVELSNGILTSAQSALSNAVTPVAPPFFPFFPGFGPFFPFFPGFAPFFPYFPPFVPFFPYFPYFPTFCFDEATPIMVVSEDGGVAYKRADEINIGDDVWAVNWDELIPENIQDPTTWSSDTMTNSAVVKTKIINISPSEKDITMIINGDQEKRFSLEQVILVKRSDTYMFISSGVLEIGDFVVEVSDNKEIQESLVESVDFINESRKVFKFDADPVDTLIAGNMIMHNAKAF